MVENEDAATSIRSSYRYILVDEYQDVNYAQHRLLALLAAEHGNLCVVGDPLQNLFSWRGSDIRYLLDFQRDYPDGRVISLEQNYRSTQVILSVANALSAALQYGARNLWTANGPGVSVVLRVCDDPRTEASFIATEVQRLMAEVTIRSPGDCAVLYRTNAQARDLEMACLEAGVPYSVRGNSDFLARKEIRDLFAYLRLLHNPNDVAALGRIIKKRPSGDTSQFGVGEKTWSDQAYRRSKSRRGRSLRTATGVSLPMAPSGSFEGESSSARSSGASVPGKSRSTQRSSGGAIYALPGLPGYGRSAAGMP